MSERERCAKTVRTRTGPSYRCTRAGVWREGGCWWCRQHKPSFVRARRAEKQLQERRGQRAGVTLAAAREEVLAQAKRARGSKLLPRQLAAAVDALLALEGEGS